jgi:hypothetical protein
MAIFIYGDSFSLAEGPNSWVNLLKSEHEIKNKSLGGASNHYIFLKFIEDINTLTENDIVVICWSDWSRHYSIDPKTVTENFKSFYKYFWNMQLLEVQSSLYLDKIKLIASEKNLRLLFIWGFPTSFGTIKFWTDPGDVHIEHLKYSHCFENEIRPALMYFSRKELPTEISCNQNDITEFFINDQRPNHLANKDVHIELATIIKEFYQSKISGQINLKDRLKLNHNKETDYV